MATICNVRIFDGTAFRKESAVTFENGTVTALDDRREGEDMGGVLLCPGFVDIHMHGQKGLDSMRPGDNGRMAETQVKYGVTSFCPASITETDEAIRAYLADIRTAMELERGGVKLNTMWNRRQTTKFNGVPYVVQRGAQAVYSDAGRAQVRETIAFYQNNARVIQAGLAGAGLTVSGGENSPYVWAKTPHGMGSWAFFDLLLQQAGVVTTPGAGFGPSGEGYIRLSAFGGAEDTAEAVERIRAVL